MYVLFQIREDYNKNIAGDSIQMLMTKKYLEALGVKVEVSGKFNVKLDKYDIVHIFNTIRIKEPYLFAHNALKQNKPYVVSTIYWNMSSYIKKANNETDIHWWLQSQKSRKEVLMNASALLPNSNTEKQILLNDFKLRTSFFIVPNGCDKIFYQSSSRKFEKKYHLKEFVLCVGRMTFRKNQLTLLNALHQTKYPIVLIGPHQNGKYYELCKKAANKNVVFIDQMNYFDLSSAYSAAKVHVLPSWFETPGLSNIEAGLAGCNIVLTNNGCQKEYFKDYAAYCNPSSEKNIRLEVDKMYWAKKTKGLSIHIYRNYTWEKAAEKTLQSYHFVLEQQ